MTVHELQGRAHAALASRTSCAGRTPRVRDERGQGTVEYVGLVLLVAALMGGMVAAVGGLGSLSGIGKELAEAITKKIIQGVQKITFGG
jgi:Flp pilus assembly pilin Flp